MPGSPLEWAIRATGTVMTVGKGAIADDCLQKFEKRLLGQVQASGKGGRDGESFFQTCDPPDLLKPLTSLSASFCAPSPPLPLGCAIKLLGE